MSEFHEHAPNVKNFQLLEKKDPIFGKIRENLGNVPIIQKIIQNYSVVSLIVNAFSAVLADFRSGSWLGGGTDG